MIPIAFRERLASRRSQPGPQFNRYLAFAGVAVAIGLTFYSPMLGILLFMSLLAAALYMFGRSDLAPVATYIMMLYFLSPRLALGVYEVTPAMLIGLGCFGLWLSGRAAVTVERRVGSPMTTMVAVFFLVILLTYGLGLTQPLLFDQVRGADRNLVKLLALVGVVLLMIDVIRTRQQLDNVVGLMVVGGTFMTAAAVFQGFFDFDIVDQFQLPGFQDRGIRKTGLKLRLGLRRATGTARHPIELGTASAMVLPLALHLTAYARTSRTRMASMGSAATIVLAMFLSLSRSAYIGLFVALLMLIPRWTSQRRFRFILSLMPMIVAVLTLAPEATDAAFDLLSDWRGENIEGTRISARTEDYDIIRELVAQRPWFGQGFGTFTGDTSFAADNQYLSLLIETGIVGVSSLIGMMAMAYGLSRRSYRAAATDRDRDLAASVAASVVGGIVAFGVFDAMAFDLSVGSLFLMFGIAAALYRIVSNDEMSKRRVLAHESAEPSEPSAAVEPDDQIDVEDPAVLVGSDAAPASAGSTPEVGDDDV